MPNLSIETLMQPAKQTLAMWVFYLHSCKQCILTTGPLIWQCPPQE